MTTQATDYQREHDMMSTPDKWPRWPFLPLTRHVGNSLQLGFMVETSTDPLTDFKVYVGNILAPTYDKFTNYESVDAIIAAGSSDGTERCGRDGLLEVTSSPLTATASGLWFGFCFVQSNQTVQWSISYMVK